MTPATAVLALVDDRALRDDVDRVAAAAAVRVVHAHRPSSRTVWVSAQVVVLDAAAAARCADEGLPRRDRVYLVGTAEPGDGDWKAAVSVGAQRVIRLPDQDGELVDAFTTASQNSGRRAPRCGHRDRRRVRRGGRPLFAAALAQAAPQALLVDTDPWGGGLDPAMGTEGVPGLRRQDLTLRDGRLGFEALRTALPARGRVTVLSGVAVMAPRSRPGH